MTDSAVFHIKHFLSPCTLYFEEFDAAVNSPREKLIRAAGKRVRLKSSGRELTVAESLSSETRWAQQQLYGLLLCVCACV